MYYLLSNFFHQRLFFIVLQTTRHPLEFLLPGITLCFFCYYSLFLLRIFFLFYLILINSCFLFFFPIFLLFKKDFFLYIFSKWKKIVKEFWRLFQEYRFISFILFLLKTKLIFSFFHIYLMYIVKMWREKSLTKYVSFKEYFGRNS